MSVNLTASDYLVISVRLLISTGEAEKVQVQAVTYLKQVAPPRDIVERTPIFNNPLPLNCLK